MALVVTAVMAAELAFEVLSAVPRNLQSCSFSLLALKQDSLCPCLQLAASSCWAEAAAVEGAYYQVCSVAGMGAVAAGPHLCQTY